MSLTSVQWTRRGWLLFVVLIAASVLLLRLYFATLQKSALQEHVENLEQLALSVEQVLQNTQNHVRRLQQAAQFSLHNGEAPRELDRLIKPATPTTPEDFTLDALQQAQPQAQMGNVFLLGNPSSRMVLQELRIIETLFPIAAASHLSDSTLQWTYYSSFVSRLTSIFPYRNYQGLIEDAGVDNLAAFYERYLPLERRRQGINELANVQAPVWRRAHEDLAGAGWVVPLSAPVRYKGEILGAVSADVRLSFFSMHLSRYTRAPHRTLLLNEDMRVLADSRIIGDSHARMEYWHERLPFPVQADAREVNRDNPGWVEGKDVYFYSRPLSQSAWLLVSMVPSGDLFFAARIRLLMLIVPLVIVLAGLMFWWYRHAKHLSEKEKMGAFL